MGTTIRTTLVALVSAALLVAGGTPASVAGNEEFRTGKRCTENSDAVKRCAAIRQFSPSSPPRHRKYQAEAYVEEYGEQQVRMRLILFQRKTDDGWSTVARRKWRLGWDDSYQIAWTDTRRCRATAKDTFRTRARVQWRHPDFPTTISRAWINSTPLRKRQFC